MELNKQILEEGEGAETPLRILEGHQKERFKEVNGNGEPSWWKDPLGGGAGYSSYETIRGIDYGVNLVAQQNPPLHGMTKNVYMECLGEIAEYRADRVSELKQDERFLKRAKIQDDDASFTGSRAFQLLTGVGIGLGGSTVDLFYGGPSLMTPLSIAAGFGTAMVINNGTPTILGDILGYNEEVPDQEDKWREVSKALNYLGEGNEMYETDTEIVTTPKQVARKTRHPLGASKIDAELIDGIYVRHDRSTPRDWKELKETKGWRKHEERYPLSFKVLGGGFEVFNAVDRAVDYSKNIAMKPVHYYKDDQED